MVFSCNQDNANKKGFSWSMTVLHWTTRDTIQCHQWAWRNHKHNQTEPSLKTGGGGGEGGVTPDLCITWCGNSWCHPLSTHPDSPKHRAWPTEAQAVPIAGNNRFILVTRVLTFMHFTKQNCYKYLIRVLNSFLFLDVLHVLCTFSGNF